jgi:F-type H+-transporting ATPase subunit delta
MSNARSAGPYLRVLFDLSLEHGDPRAIDEEISAFVTLVADQPELRRTLESALFAPDVKKGIVDRIATQAGFSLILRGVLASMAERHDLDALPALARGFHARVLDHLNVVEAHVTTAKPLTPALEAALAKGLQDATGRDVRFTAAVDPSLVGGVVTRIGSTVYDGSVTRQLARLREQLVEQV